MDPNDLVLSLSAALPEDIARAKEAGYFEKAVSLIDARLKGELPQMMRRRLICEKREAAPAAPAVSL